jgi:protein TonB
MDNGIPGGSRIVASGDLTARGDGARLTVLSAWQGGHAWYGLTSVLLHIVALGAAVTLVARPLEPPLPNDRTIEMVFQQPEEPPPPEPVSETLPPPPPSEPMAQTPPQPPEQATETTPEPPPPEPVAEPDRPQPEKMDKPPIMPPPPEPLPPPVTRPIPAPPPPKPRLPPRTPARSPMTKPAPVTEPSRPVPPAATAAPAVVAPAAAPVVDPSWQASVFGWIAARKTYPEEARQRGEEGRVAVRFTVDRSGRVLDAAIVGPSGSQRLDEAAVELLKHASLPAFPASMTQARIVITTTMRYSLR